MKSKKGGLIDGLTLFFITMIAIFALAAMSTQTTAVFQSLGANFDGGLGLLISGFNIFMLAVLSLFGLFVFGGLFRQ